MMLDRLLIFMFVLCGAIFAYHHFIYPIVLRRLGAARRASGENVNQQPAPLTDADLPSIALIIPAYNEAGIIAQKLANIAVLDYPPDRLSIIFALDGCSDDTYQILSSEIANLPADAPKMDIFNHQNNRGKISLLNDHIGQVSEHIVALNDTSAMIEPDALRRAAAYYQDDNVGVVCATYKLKEAGSEGERIYWNYQTQIKKDESAIASAIGPHGAFYLIRRDLWTPLPTDTINDDFILPMRIVADGYRAVYDPEIIAMEAEQTTSDQEFRRRVRIGAGNMQQLLRLARLGAPRLGWVAFLFWSGKGTRPLIPFVVLLAILATLMLALRGWVFFQWCLAAEILLFALAALVIRRKNTKWPKLLAWLGYLVEGHTASFIGALRVLSGSSMRW